MNRAFTSRPQSRMEGNQQSARSHISRRDFIRITAVTGAAAGVGACTDHVLGTNGLTEVRETRHLMGTIANLTLLTTDKDSGQVALAAAFSEMERLESILSRFQSSSQLSRLNRTGSVREADPALIAVLERSLTFGELTGGAFDVTVEPILMSYREAVARGRDLEAFDVGRILACVDYRRIILGTRSIQMAGKDMKVTLDGIAKGFVIDCGADKLIDHGFERIMVEVGGDLMAGLHEEGTWSVGIHSPRPAGADLLAKAELRHMALATSGDYMNSFTEDYRHHHILDPRSGISPAELCSASVVAPSAMDADALSTSLMVLGIEEGLGFIETLPGVEALLISKNQTPYPTAGFPASVERPASDEILSS